MTVVLLIVLRLSLGCHFLYEGVWKITHRDEFTAKPFLDHAKGPLAGFFYAMIPDINGRQRLQIVKDSATGKEKINSAPIIARWDAYRLDLVNSLKPGEGADQDAVEAQQRFENEAKEIGDKHEKLLDAYLSDNLADIKAYFASLDRFQNNPEAHQDAPFQKKNRWDRMLQLRAEAAVWINDIAAREKSFQNALYEAMDENQRQQVSARWPDWKLWNWNRIDQINFAVTYGLTAIGLCLMLGFCTRLAALGGAAFMCFVVMTQPAWPTIYPPDPAVVGHALIVNKDFIEMVALLLISTTAVGRWGGLDFFLNRWFVKPFCKRCK
ncbi:MAG: hypothetical protein ACWGMZ_04080 [Thermoguttaceae bacterium]